LLNAVSGVHRDDFNCDVCGDESGVSGIRWKCAVCDDYDLCHSCYMSNQHDLTHWFIRYNTPLSIGYILSQNIVESADNRNVIRFI